MLCVCGEKGDQILPVQSAGKGYSEVEAHTKILCCSGTWELLGLVCVESAPPPSA